MSGLEILTKLEAVVSAVRTRQSEREQILNSLDDEISSFRNGGVDLDKIQGLVKEFTDLNTDDYQASAELSTLLLISSGIKNRNSTW